MEENDGSENIFYPIVSWKWRLLIQETVYDAHVDQHSSILLSLVLFLNVDIDWFVLITIFISNSVVTLKLLESHFNFASSVLSCANSAKLQLEQTIFCDWLTLYQFYYPLNYPPTTRQAIFYRPLFSSTLPRRPLSTSRRNINIQSHLKSLWTAKYDVWLMKGTNKFSIMSGAQIRARVRLPEQQKKRKGGKRQAELVGMQQMSFLICACQKSL